MRVRTWLAVSICAALAACGETAGETAGPSGDSGPAGGLGGTASVGGTGGLGGTAGEGGSAGAWAPVQLVHGVPAEPTACGECLPGVTRVVEGNGSWAAGGWSPHDWGDRVVYDFGGGVDCGTLELRVDELVPFVQFRPQGAPEAYVEFVALFENADDTHVNAMSELNFVYTPCFDCTAPEDHYRMKVNSGLVTNCALNTDPPAAGCADHCKNQVQDCDETETDTCDWDSSSYTGPIFDPANGKSFTLRLQWSPHGVSLQVKGDLGGDYQTKTQYPVYPNQCYTLPKTPNWRYLILGRPRFPAGAYSGYLDGAVFAYVDAWKHDCSTVAW